MFSPSELLFLPDYYILKQRSTPQQQSLCPFASCLHLNFSHSQTRPSLARRSHLFFCFAQMTNTPKDTDINKRTMSRQHHRSLSTPPTGFYDIMEFFTGGSQNRGMAKVRRAHTTATTTPTLTAPGKKTSLQSPLLCPHLVNVYKGQALPRSLRATHLLQDDFVEVIEEGERCGFLLTREQSVWGIDAVCSEICRRGNQKIQGINMPCSRIKYSDRLRRK